MVFENIIALFNIHQQAAAIIPEGKPIMGMITKKLWELT